MQTTPLVTALLALLVQLALPAAGVLVAPANATGRIDYRRLAVVHKSDVSAKLLGETINPILFNELMPELSVQNTRRLVRLLGDKLDTAWTALTRPADEPYDETVSYDPRLELYFDTLNFTALRGPDAPTDATQLVQQWLMDKATCRMQYFWEELGNLFWPPFVRRGACVNPSASSCSWPPGMKCRLAGAHTVHYLRWTCAQSDEPPPRRQKRADLRQRRPRPPRNSYAFWNPVRRKRQVKNLIRKTSIWSRGYLCEWRIKNFNIANRCECSCE